MLKNSDDYLNQHGMDALRRDAMERIDRDPHQRSSFKKEVIDPKSLNLKMAKRLIEELQIYQVELELQNEELRNAQQELEFSRDQYAELYHEAPVGYLSIDNRGHIIEINKTACNLFSVQSALVIGQPFSNFVARIDLELYYRFINQLFNEIPTGESNVCEMRVRCAGNLQNYVELTGVIRLEPHSGRRICRIVLQDIEDRKMMEEKQRLLQAAVEYSTDGISISDMRQLDNPIIYVSPKLEELSGYKAEELIGNNWRLLYEEEPDEDARNMMREALSLGRECRTYVRNIRKDGTPFFCEVTLYPLTDTRGMITHYVSVIRDITEQRETDKAIQQAQRLDSIGVLAGGIAHDFNNILQGVIVQSTIALRKLEENHPAQSNIEKSYKAANKAADLTRQLLAYAGRGNFDVEQIDINQLIEETRDLVSSSIPPQIELISQLNDSPLRIEADRGQVQQILLNLIMNASEAIDGKGKIGVKTQRYFPSTGDPSDRMIQNGDAPGQLASNKQYALIEVEDNGCGMDEKTITRIFDPFFTTKELGHGLGLSAAMGVIRTQKGSIQVESRPKVGTKFSVFLPLAEIAKPRQEDPQVSENRRDIPGEPVILIVDDDDNVREALDQALDFLGCQVINAVDGIDGIEKYSLNQDRIDLVLMDFHMPGMDGEETFKHLQGINPELKCIFSSGFGPDKTRKQIGHLDGRIDYLQKPYDLPTLRSAIVGILDE